MKYEINLDSLFSIQDDTANKVDLKRLGKSIKGQKNKEALLKIALPFYHSVLALHNRKCSNSFDSSTGQRGLLGLSVEDINKQLLWIAETDYHGLWSYNFSQITLSLNRVNVKIWLNNVLREVAQACQSYRDDWKK